MSTVLERNGMVDVYVVTPGEEATFELPRSRQPFTVVNTEGQAGPAPSMHTRFAIAMSPEGLSPRTLRITDREGDAATDVVRVWTTPAPPAVADEAAQEDEAPEEEAAVAVEEDETTAEAEPFVTVVPPVQGQSMAPPPPRRTTTKATAPRSRIHFLRSPAHAVDVAGLHFFGADHFVVSTRGRGTWEYDFRRSEIRNFATHEATMGHTALQTSPLARWSAPHERGGAYEIEFVDTLRFDEDGFPDDSMMLRVMPQTQLYNWSLGEVDLEADRLDGTAEAGYQQAIADHRRAIQRRNALLFRSKLQQQVPAYPGVADPWLREVVGRMPGAVGQCWRAVLRAYGAVEGVRALWMDAPAMAALREAVRSQDDRGVYRPLMTVLAHRALQRPGTPADSLNRDDYVVEPFWYDLFNEPLGTYHHIVYGEHDGAWGETVRRADRSEGPHLWLDATAAPWTQFEWDIRTGERLDHSATPLPSEDWTHWSYVDGRPM